MANDTMQEAQDQPGTAATPPPATPPLQTDPTTPAKPAEVGSEGSEGSEASDALPPGPDGRAGTGQGRPDADAERDPAELSAEELRLMADTMPGDGPGGD